MVYIVGKAVHRVLMTGFTFDLLIITQAVQALIEAAQRGVDVVIVLDYSHTLTGSTMWMVDRLSQLKAGGVKLLLSAGVSGDSGIQHNKTVLCDEYVNIGSCNWASASRQNQETGVLIALNEVGLAAYDERLKYIEEHSRAFTDELEKEGREHRSESGASVEVRLQRRLNFLHAG